MILVDTSIWIEFLKQNPAFVYEMVFLLESKQVIAIEPVFSELIYGSRSEKEKNKIISYWKALPHVKFSEGSLIEAASDANKNNYYTIGKGLIDAILTKAATENKLLMWTLDKKILASLDKQFLYKS